ncbi:MAG TPA: non-homologous end-joining DNA ligase, partial [Gaiellaceae bacterium]|nr:non-homologous end-joining DNA ligase [Gaiellaceae bacterium]
MAGLTEYERKRTKAKTPEPFGGKKRGKAPIFVVQRHDARRLHYDFRLERDGALASWAVPKGIPLEAGERHLAVHVEDHPLDYASFEGEIPAGNYGAGTVEIWDEGTYELVEEKRDGGLTVRLDGKRLRGLWTLVPAKLSGDPKNWLLIKKRDETGEKGAGTSARPPEVSPMLATLVDGMPQGSGWVYEVKWDGYRAIATIAGGEVKLTSRNGNDLTGRFSEVAKQIGKAVRTPNAVLDGEVCALDEDGRSSFSEMQKGSANLVYYVFDALWVEGESLLGLPLTERKARLESLLDRRNPQVRISESFEDGVALMQAAREQRLEGVIAKKAGSAYIPGKRTRDWLKVKTEERQEFLIAGYTKGQGRRASSLGALVLAVHRGGNLVWAGNCGTGFDEQEIQKLLRKLRPLERKTSPFKVVPKMPKVRKGAVVWVTPKLVCEVRFSEWTHDGRLRAPSYQGLREDKPPSEVRRELPL